MEESRLLRAGEMVASCSSEMGGEIGLSLLFLGFLLNMDDFLPNMEELGGGGGGDVSGMPPDCEGGLPVG